MYAKVILADQGKLITMLKCYLFCLYTFTHRLAKYISGAKKNCKILMLLTMQIDLFFNKCVFNCFIYKLKCCILCIVYVKNINVGYS